jgi:hypothetical protein
MVLRFACRLNRLDDICLYLYAIPKFLKSILKKCSLFIELSISDKNLPLFRYNLMLKNYSSSRPGNHFWMP